MSSQSVVKEGESGKSLEGERGSGEDTSKPKLGQKSTEESTEEPEEKEKPPNTYIIRPNFAHKYILKSLKIYINA